MSVSRNNDHELALFECYQAEPVLWQSQHKDHKNKNKLHDAWTRISNIMNVPVADLKKKKESLMSSYRAYRKKVKDSIQSGAGLGVIYKPIWFAYDIMDSFLGDGVQCKETINTEASTLNEENEEEQGSSSRNVDSISTKSQTIRRRKIPAELSLAGETVLEAISTLKTTMNTQQSPKDDECELHGKIIAKKLRKLSENDREQFVSEIYQMFLRVGRHNQPQTPAYLSPSTTYMRSPSDSTYSEPQIYQQSAHSSRSAYSEPAIDHSPVIHIPEKITNNGLIQPDIRDPTDYENLIEEFTCL